MGKSFVAGSSHKTPLQKVSGIDHSITLKCLKTKARGWRYGSVVDSFCFKCKILGSDAQHSKQTITENMNLKTVDAHASKILFSTVTQGISPLVRHKTHKYNTEQLNCGPLSYQQFYKLTAS